jgi:hypothetical protein
MVSFFNTMSSDVLFGNHEGTNVCNVKVDGDPETFSELVNKKILVEYTKFLQNEFKEDPKLYNRNLLYESEIKSDSIIYRWV